MPQEIGRKAAESDQPLCRRCPPTARNIIVNDHGACQQIAIGIERAVSLVGVGKGNEDSFHFFGQITKDIRYKSAVY